MRTDSRGFALRDEHCSRVWPVSRPDLPEYGEYLYSLTHAGIGSFHSPVKFANARSHELISNFLLEVLS